MSSRSWPGTLPSYENGEVLALAGSGTISAGNYAETVEFQSDQGNGRLLLWEIVQDNSDGVAQTERSHIQVVPNPARDVLRVVSDGSVRITHWRIMTLQGSFTGNAGTNAGHIRVGELAAGPYVIEVHSADGRLLRSVWVKQ